VKLVWRGVPLVFEALPGPIGGGPKTPLCYTSTYEAILTPFAMTGR